MALASKKTGRGSDQQHGESLWHILRFQGQTGITVHFSHRSLEGKRLGPQIETAAYRLVQEALNNVARHAQAWGARVEAYAQDERLLIGIEDRGRGFDPRAGLAQDRGLSSMREQVRRFSGQFLLESQAGRASPSSSPCGTRAGNDYS